MIPARIGSTVASAVIRRRAWGEWFAPIRQATPLETLRNHRLLCIMDDDNLRIALRTLGFALSYRTLHARLTDCAASIAPWVVRSAADGAPARGRYLTERGWNVVQVPREVVMHRGVPTVKGNVDHELAFLAGRLSSTGDQDAILLGTGDGDLAVAVARCLREYTPAGVYTLSVPGSSSRRLTDAGLFADRILIGRDLVVAIRRAPRSSGRRRGLPAPPATPQGKYDA